MKWGAGVGGDYPDVCFTCGTDEQIAERISQLIRVPRAALSIINQLTSDAPLRRRA